MRGQMDLGRLATVAGVHCKARAAEPLCKHLTAIVMILNDQDTSAVRHRLPGLQGKSADRIHRYRCQYG